MLTTMDVVVEELCTNTVAKIPIMSPATGFLRILLDLKASPAAFPPNNRKALLRKSKEQMKKYRSTNNRTILANTVATRFIFPRRSKSVDT